MKSLMSIWTLIAVLVELSQAQWAYNVGHHPIRIPSNYPLISRSTPQSHPIIERYSIDDYGLISRQSPHCRHEGLNRISGDCGGYCNCIRNDGLAYYQVYQHRCPDGLVFDESLGSCTWPRNVADCGLQPEIETFAIPKQDKPKRTTTTTPAPEQEVQQEGQTDEDNVPDPGVDPGSPDPDGSGGTTGGGGAGSDGGTGTDGSGGTGSDGTGPDGSGPGGAEPDGTGSDGTGPDGSGPGGAGPDGSGSDGTGSDGTGPGNAGPDGSGPGGAGPGGAGSEGTGSDGSLPDGGDGNQGGESPPESPQEGYKCPSEGFQKAPGNCSKFYRCVNDGNGGFTIFVFNCPSGLLYDESLQTCNWPQNVKGCGESGGNSGSIVNPPGSGGSGSGGNPPGSGGSGSGGNPPGSGGSGSGGNPPGSGGSGTSNCKRRQNCSSSGSLINTPGGIGSGGKPPGSAGSGSGGKPPGSAGPGSGGKPPGSGGGGASNCKRRQNCDSSGKPTGSGGTGSGGNPPGNGGSGGKPPGSGGSDSGGNPPGSGGSGSEGNPPGSGGTGGSEVLSSCKQDKDFYRDPSDCSKFYRCTNKIEYAFNCPELTVFDDKLNICNWPSNIPPPCGTYQDPSTGNETSSQPPGEDTSPTTSTTPPTQKPKPPSKLPKPKPPSKVPKPKPPSKQPKPPLKQNKPKIKPIRVSKPAKRKPIIKVWDIRGHGVHRDPLKDTGNPTQRTRWTYITHQRQRPVYTTLSRAQPYGQQQYYILPQYQYQNQYLQPVYSLKK